jgi:ABC-type uncharacterized transport system involved in gliding motility auxiliary subunit
MNRNKLISSLGSVTGVFVVLGIVILVNILVSRLPSMRMDLTAERLYTLSTNTKSMLGDLERDVALKFYFSRSARSTPIPIKQYAQRIQDLLGEYETHGRGRIRLEVLDPEPDSDEEEWAQKYGLQAQGLGPFGGESFYLGVAAVAGTREAAIPFLAPSAEPQLEYLLTRLIHEVSQTERPTIGLMTSLPVMGTPQMPFRQPQGPQAAKWAVIADIERLYAVREVSPTVEEIPADLETLLVLHPKDLSEKTLFALDQFVLRGGRLLAFMDAMALAEQETQQQPNQFGGMGTGSDLNRLTQAWGLEMRPGKLLGDPAAATTISRGAAGGGEESIAWLSLRGERVNREDVATASLEFVMMPFAGALSGEPAEGLSMTPLVSPSDDAGLLDTFAAMGPSSAARKDLERESGLLLGVRLQGNFKTAFPDGPPEDAAPEEDGDEAGETEEETPAYLTESDGRGAVILVSDVDMLYDRFAVRTMSFLGQTMMQPVNDNLNFALNLIEQMAGSEALIGLRSRGTYERPFTKVLQLQQEAQDRYQDEELSLQEELQEAQSRINELQAAKDQDQRFILSPAQADEIEKFNEKVFETRQKLKEVRKNLRKDIEALGLKLKFINIAAVPLAIAGFGIVRGLRRRQRASAA